MPTHMKDAPTSRYVDIAEYVIATGLGEMRQHIEGFNVNGVECMWITKDKTDKCFVKAKKSAHVLN